MRVVDAFVDSLDLTELGSERTVAAATGRPGFRPGDMLRHYIWSHLNHRLSQPYGVRADGQNSLRTVSTKPAAGQAKRKFFLENGKD